MKEFKVPKRGVTSSVRMCDGSILEATLFVPKSGPDGAPGRVIDRLNDEGERFVPAKVGGRHELLNTDRIVWVRLETAEVTADPVVPASHAHDVGVTLSDGATVEGTVRFVMPPERSRLLDYCNAAPTFILLEGPTPTILNRRFIMRIEGRTE